MLWGSTPPAYAEAAETLSKAATPRLWQILRDAQGDPALRREAALLLVNRANTAEELLRDLAGTTDAVLRRAILSALHQSRRPLPEKTSEVVLSIIASIETGSFEDAAELIGRGSAAETIAKVTALAVSPTSAETTRLIATSALGYQRTQAAAKTLISLIESRQPASIRSAALAGLVRLSGIDSFNNDRARWQQWWSQARDLKPEAWQEHLLANFVRRAEMLARQRTLFLDRLLLTQRQRYRGALAQDRQPILVGMLADPLDPVRELALELIRELISSETISEELTAAILQRLDDATPSIRAGATLVLRDLKHTGAADTVAARLAEAGEQDRTVLKAYLLMMRRLPRAAAVGPAINLLEDVSVRSEAAGALLTAYDNDPPLISTEQSQRIGQRLRPQLAGDEDPEPRFVELLGRVAEADDWKRIEGWLDSQQLAVREAAAKSWAAGNQPLPALAARAADPVIQAIVIPEATRRGARPDTMFALIEYKPKTEQLAAAWGRALIAMAGRVDSETVVKADAKLQKQGESTDLRQQFLSAAIDPLQLRVAAFEPGNGNAAARADLASQLTDLLLSRAEVRLAAGDTKAAETDLVRVTELKVELSASRQNRFDLIGIHVRILAGELDDAFLVAARFFAADNASDDALLMRDRVTDLVLACTHKCIESKQLDRATQILTRLRARVPRPMSLDLNTRISVLETRIRMAEPPTPGG
ncbi:MAG: hypothetical protein WD768_00350 [Phycisphaeraceae bacterium]